jgi:enoyl-CoA hydratase
MTESRYVTIEKKGRVGIIHVNRADKRNALDAATHAQLLEALDALRHDEEVRVGILTGTGKAFVAGIDVHEFQGRSSIQIMRRLLEQPSAIDAADAFPKPLIAMINGYCLGSGCELAMACDIRIASEDAKLGQPEVNLGMIPGAGATQRLPRLVGIGKAFTILYTGQILDSSEALRIGLVDQVVPARQLRARSLTLAEVIAQKSPAALAMIKEAVRASLRAPLDDGIRHERGLASVMFSSKDVQEGIAAFLEKRQPKFTGE